MQSCEGADIGVSNKGPVPVSAKTNLLDPVQSNILIDLSMQDHKIHKKCLQQHVVLEHDAQMPDQLANGQR
jgi:hypothetical protein